MAEPTTPQTPTPTPSPAEASPAASPPPQPPASGPGEASGASKQKRPIDAEKRERDAADAQVRRELAQLKKTKDAGKLREAAAKLKEVRAGGDAPSSGQAEPSKASTPALATTEPGQLPGWPKPSEVAAQEGLMAHLWGEARRTLPRRYSQALDVRVEEGEVVLPDGKRETVKITINPVVTLAKGTAPLAAELMGKVNAMTPAAAAAVAVATVFVPPFLAHMKDILFGEASQPAQVGETAAAAPEAQA